MKLYHLALSILLSTVVVSGEPLKSDFDSKLFQNDNKCGDPMNKDDEKAI